MNKNIDDDDDEDLLTMQNEEASETPSEPFKGFAAAKLKSDNNDAEVSRWQKSFFFVFFFNSVPLLHGVFFIQKHMLPKCLRNI